MSKGIGVYKKSRRSRGPRPKPSPSMAPPSPRRDYSAAERRAAIQRSASALVKGRQVGALYSYDALTPVTVPDGSAALINIVAIVFAAFGYLPPWAAAIVHNLGGVLVFLNSFRLANFKWQFASTRRKPPAVPATLPPPPTI